MGSKTAEKNSAQTNKQTNKQTNRQTDTTKIMVTWPWTKNIQHIDQYNIENNLALMLDFTLQICFDVSEDLKLLNELKSVSI